MSEHTDNLQRHEKINLAFDILRIFLGVALAVKGINFIINLESFLVMVKGEFPAYNFLLCHYVIIVHIGGGLVLAAGLLTRWSAIANLPALIGAIVFIEGPKGLFSQGQGLELAILVFIMLSFFAWTGAGKMSADYFLEKSVKEDGDIEKETMDATPIKEFKLILTFSKSKAFPWLSISCLRTEITP